MFISAIRSITLYFGRSSRNTVESTVINISFIYTLKGFVKATTVDTLFKTEYVVNKRYRDTAFLTAIRYPRHFHMGVPPGGLYAGLTSCENR